MYLKNLFMQFLRMEIKYNTNPHSGRNKSFVVSGSGSANKTTQNVSAIKSKILNTSKSFTPTQRSD
jgi:hypothetical protein